MNTDEPNLFSKLRPKYIDNVAPAVKRGRTAKDKAKAIVLDILTGRGLTILAQPPEFIGLHPNTNSTVFLVP